MCPNINIGSLELSSTTVMYLLGSVGLFIFCLLTRKKYKISLKMAVFYSLILIVAGLVEFKIMGEIQNLCIKLASDGELILGGSTRILGVLVFQPLFIFILSLFTGDKFRKIADFIAPGTFICFVFGKSACIFEGCCHGYPDENGIYSVSYEGYVFPVQVYEAISTVAVVVLLVILMSKRIKLRAGSLFPIGSVFYSILRIFWENYRYYDNPWELDFFLGMSFWQFICVLVIIGSVIWLVILYSKKKYAECSLDTSSDTLITKAIAFAKGNSERERNKHAQKAKIHKQKEKELKKKMKK